MQKFLNYFKRIDPIARFILLAGAAIELTADAAGNVLHPVLLLPVFALIVLEAATLLHKNIRRSFPLICVQIGLTIPLMLIKPHDFIMIYFFFLLDDIFNMPGSKTKNSLLWVHFACFLAEEGALYFLIRHSSPKEGLNGLFTILLIYFTVFIIFLLIHYFKSERDRLKALNAGLIDYSFQEREFLINKERAAISQELHDTLGHSLMAILMNIRYLKAMPRQSEDNIKQIREIEDLTQEAVGNLRSCVYNLRELDKNLDLHAEVDRIIRRFEELGIVSILFDYDGNAEDIPGPVKSALYKAIREGITNSIRHGDATKIQISIKNQDGSIKLVLSDNGLGCADIQKSFGLTGILDRAHELNGEAYFFSEKNKGFTIKVVLPGGSMQ